MRHTFFALDILLHGVVKRGSSKKEERMPASLSDPVPRPDARTRAAWQTQVTAAKKRPGLLLLLVRQRHELLPRFAAAYRQLRTLPRRVQRLLQRHWKQSLAGLALLLVLGTAPALAATITVTTTTPAVNNGDGFCSLIEALDNANDTTDGNVHADCTAGDPTGADTIVLPANSTHTLTSVNNSTYDDTGLPVVSSEITIKGNDSRITRDSGAPAFRIFAVNSTGSLTLTQTTISGGSTTGRGGGVYNYRGTVTVTNSTVSGNSADYGGGVNNLYSTLTVTNSTVSDNSASHRGGGVNNLYSTVTVTNSTVSGNSASSVGGGVYNGLHSTLTVTNSTVSGNSADYSGGVANRRYSILTVINSTVSGNSTSHSGGGMDNYRATVTVTNSTVSGNSASVNGGGVATSGTFSTFTLTNSTLSGNSSHFAGGVWNGTNSTLTLARTLVSGNITTMGAAEL
jgi:hypothetical protein